MQVHFWPRETPSSMLSVLRSRAFLSAFGRAVMSHCCVQIAVVALWQLWTLLVAITANGISTKALLTSSNKHVKSHNASQTDNATHVLDYFNVQVWSSLQPPQHAALPIICLIHGQLVWWGCVWKWGGDGGANWLGVAAGYTSNLQKTRTHTYRWRHKLCLACSFMAVMEFLNLCVSIVDLFISFLSDCVHTKRLLSQIFLSISLPLFLCLSLPRHCVLPLLLCILTSCWGIKSERAVPCNAYETAQQEERHRKFLHLFKYLFFIQRESLLSADPSFSSSLFSSGSFP